VEPRYSETDLSNLGLNPQRLPAHVAIIMDGNGRWARARGLPRIEGHRRGVTSVRSVVEEAARCGLRQLTLYCLSSENWKRPALELELLMRLLKRFIISERTLLMEQGIRLTSIGRTDRLPKGALNELQKTRDLTAANPGLNLCLAIDYGARDEIVTAVRSIAAKVVSGEVPIDGISEQTITDHLSTAGSPDPDLMIRTAGEMRISNFLLWQLSYAELFVTDLFWPDFRAEHFREALKSYGARDRRFGGLKPETHPPDAVRGL
jgi:undecaprenyl diphosphate synthase